MPAQTPCAHCGTVGFVRRERIISAKRTLTEYYCGRCEHSWRVLDEQDRRQVPRPWKYVDLTKPEPSRS